MQRKQKAVIISAMVIAGAAIILYLSGGLLPSERKDLQTKFERFNVVLVGKLHSQIDPVLWKFSMEKILKSPDPSNIDKHITIHKKLYPPTAHNKSSTFTLLREPYIDKQLLLFGYAENNKIVIYEGYMIAEGFGSGMDHRTEHERERDIRPTENREIPFGGWREIAYLKKLSKSWEKKRVKKNDMPDTIEENMQPLNLHEQCPKPVRLIEKTEHGTRVLQEHAYPEGIDIVYLHFLPTSYFPVNHQYNALSKDRWLEITKKTAETRKIFYARIKHYTRYKDYEIKLYNLLQTDVLLPLIKEAVKVNILYCLPQKTYEKLPDIILVENPLHEAVQDKNALTISVGASLETLSGGEPFRPDIWKAIRIRFYQYTAQWDRFLQTVPVHDRYKGKPVYHYLEGIDGLGLPNTYYIGAHAASDPYPIQIDTTETIELLIRNAFQADLTLTINRIR
ncbi:MAG: hypothetical protein EA357_01240 [Micavibrio sp.]|nr:MAG: hypothetical protein EA357_01240 [Micavibrio sp.]